MYSFTLLAFFRRKSDEILINYGGYYFNSDENMYISSKKTLLRPDLSDIKRFNRKAPEERLRLLEEASSKMPHEEDMSDYPGYINKMFTVRSDLSVSLCKCSSKIQTTKAALKCHYSIFHVDIWRRLLPFKIEVLNTTPSINLVHEFISHQGKETKSICSLDRSSRK